MSMICLSLTKTVEVKDIFHLYSHSLRLEYTVLVALFTKLAILGISITALRIQPP